MTADAGMTPMDRIDITLDKNGYIIGSTVVVQDVAIKAPEPVPEKPAFSPAALLAAGKSRAKAPSRNFRQVIILALAGLICVFISFNYLRVQTNVTALQKSVSNLEVQLENQRISNDNLETSINASVNLTDIYKIATEKYHMVYPKNGQVLFYDSSDKEYVQQSNTIPEK